MAICAYCKLDRPLTREHVIPSWYTASDVLGDGEVFLDRAPKKRMITDIVVRDVCHNCNGGPLSRLDNYGKSIYEKYLANPIYKDELIDIYYDFLSLAKWLLKIAFNSARIHNTDLSVLGEYADLIITDKDLPKEFFISVRAIAPGVIEDDLPNVASIADEDEVKPEWFRTGVFRVPDFDSLDWSFRQVMIDGYMFLIFVPKLSGVPIEELNELTSIVEKRGFGTIMDRGGYMRVGPPDIDAISITLQHMMNFPITYDTLDDDIEKGIYESGADLFHYLIPRQDVEMGGVDDFIGFFNNAMRSRETVMQYMEKVEFSISGYDDDSRELWNIPEVISYLKKLNKIFPYWILFQHPHGRWLKFLMFCLLHDDSGSKASESDDDFRSILDGWFYGLNELCHKFCFSEVINMRLTDNTTAIMTK